MAKLNKWDRGNLIMDHNRQEVEVKLPKQWKDWCKQCGLRATNSGFKLGKFKKYDYFTLKGKGRHWRVNCYGELQCSERYENFDRWANSHQESESMPVSFVDFRNVVYTLMWRMGKYENNRQGMEAFR